MYKIMIVDDEEAARRGLKTCVDWKSLGAEVCAEAINGQQALNMVDIVLPDIILTDVRMPFVDGIELCSRLKSAGCPSKLIFISGYGDQEYLKSALRLNAQDYILKPVDVEELLRVVSETIALIEAERQNQHTHNQMMEKLNQSMPLLRERFLLELLRNPNVFNTEILKAKLDFLDIHMPVQSRYGLFVIRIFYKPDNELEQHIINMRIYDLMCNKLKEKNIEGQIISTGSNEYAIIMPLPDCPETSSDTQLLLADELIENINRLHHVNINIGIGQEVQELEFVHKSYKVAQDALSQSYFTGRNCVLLSNSQAYLTETKVAWNNGPELTQALKTFDFDRINKMLIQIFEKTMENSLGIGHVHTLYRGILTTVIITLYEIGLENHPLIENTLDVMERIAVTDTMQDSLKELSSFLFMVCSTLAQTHKNNRELIIKQIKDIINEHLVEKFTIHDISEKVHYSEAYISTLFKQETGQTINEYITACRMRLAEELLKNPSLKMYQIAEMVGYSDIKYFSRLFRRYTGKNPSNYRN